MTFNQVVWKMAKVNYRKYIFYYLCNSFAVMFFFMFSTVYFNRRVEEGKQTESLQDALSIPGVALIIFTVFFISYAHNVFMKKRRSEFGLFMTLGMARRDISKLLVLENGVIAIASVFSGILAGAVFSRLFFMLLMKLIDLEGIPFHLSGKMFAYSIGAFTAVFLLAVGKSLFQMLRSSVILSMKSNRFAESIKMRSPLLGAFGLLLLVGSLLVLYFTYQDSSGAFLPLWTMAMFLGLYISLNQATSFLVNLAKRFPGFYYRRLLFLSNLDYKFKQLTSIVMLVTVMIMITIFYSTLLLTFYKASEKDAINNNPYDVAFFQTETKNSISAGELGKLFDLEEHETIPVFNYYEKLVYVDGYQTYNFMSLDDFNRLTSNEKKLTENEYLFYLNSEPEFAPTETAESVEISIGNDKKTFKKKDQVIERNINLLPNAYEFIVVNPEVFRKLGESFEGYILNLQLLNVEDWKSSGAAVEQIKEQLADGNQVTPKIEYPGIESVREEELFRVASKVGEYETNKTTNGMMFYVTTFLSIMFFVGTFVLLYLNLYSEVETEKAKYRKLNKIGMSAKEIKGNVTRELGAIFFVPTLLGTTLAFLYLVILSTDVGGIMKNPDILMHFLLIAGTYLIIQVGSFFYARKNMLKQLL
ncbi:ABC transporter permease [Bacillus sp. ISL-35]|uniref:ABC transporter permease n=1 Tax=Bacillus sp. ISL-35 TaxID=2819122 RepID=UPI001BEB3FEF|nr:ABC transporter permease [Bacillus sp. ISL-35]MBT2679379.1 ABC transporter permease [Bacillus sp. ISL-35]MBT2703279.1 ABC transporter permease [Chryseobacterium sp. ISL-80]